LDIIWDDLDGEMFCRLLLKCVNEKYLEGIKYSD
jgi:hypothetical protein